MTSRYNLIGFIINSLLETRGKGMVGLTKSDFQIFIFLLHICIFELLVCYFHLYRFICAIIYRFIFYIHTGVLFTIYAHDVYWVGALNTIFIATLIFSEPFLNGWLGCGYNGIQRVITQNVELTSVSNNIQRHKYMLTELNCILTNECWQRHLQLLFMLILKNTGIVKNVMWQLWKIIINLISHIVESMWRNSLIIFSSATC